MVIGNSKGPNPNLPASTGSGVSASILLGLFLLCAAVFTYNRIVYRTHSVSSEKEFSTWAAPLNAIAQNPHLGDTPAEIARTVLPLVLAAIWIAASLKSPSLEDSSEATSIDWPRLLAATLFVFAMNCAVAMMDNGLSSLSFPFSNPSGEYFADARRVTDIGALLKHYPQLVHATHSRTHPPGGVIFLCVVARGFGSGMMTAAVVTIAVTACTLIPATLIARRFLSQAGLTIFIACYALAPSLVIFGATSVDGVFAFVLLLAAAGYFCTDQLFDSMRAIIVRGVVLGAALALATFFTLSTLGLIMLFIVSWMLDVRRSLQTRDEPGRKRARATFISLSIAAMTLVAIFALLFVATDCNMIDCARGAIAWDGQIMAKVRPHYLDVSFTNLFAFLVGSGFITSALAIRGLFPIHVPGFTPSRIGVPLAITILLLSFSRLFTRETERVWLFFMPLLLIAAADVLAHIPSRRERSAWIAATLVLLMAQSWLTQLLLFTFL